MRYELLSNILKNNNIKYQVIANIKFNKNTIAIEGNKLAIYSNRTGNYLGDCSIEQLIKYEHKIEYVVTNNFLYYLANIEAINKHNAIVEASI